jgi:zinc transport system permease protein
MMPLVAAGLLDLLGYQFFQYAIMGGIVATLACAWIGLFLVLRKEAMIVDGVAHTAFGGIAIGLFLGVAPLIPALAVSILAVLTITYMRRKGLAQSDSAIAVMLALGFSIGLIVISLAGGFNVELFSYLFGSILTISQADLILITGLSIFIIAFMTVFYKELLAITFDEGSSRLTGIPVEALALAFNLMVAVTIVVTIKIIGIILVVALVVIPALSALQFRLSFRKTMLASIIIGVVSMISGIFLSAIYNVATSGVIVFAAVGIFLTSAAYNRLR